MTVAELIAALQTCPQGAHVVTFVDWERSIPINELSPEDSDGHVVLGDDLPSELYARDFKYED